MESGEDDEPEMEVEKEELKKMKEELKKMKVSFEIPDLLIDYKFLNRLFFTMKFALCAV